MRDARRKVLAAPLGSHGTPASRTDPSGGASTMLTRHREQQLDERKRESSGRNTHSLLLQGDSRGNRMEVGRGRPQTDRRRTTRRETRRFFTTKMPEVLGKALGKFNQMLFSNRQARGGARGGGAGGGGGVRGDSRHLRTRQQTPKC